MSEVLGCEDASRACADGEKNVASYVSAHAPSISYPVLTPFLQHIRHDDGAKLLQHLIRSNWRRVLGGIPVWKEVHKELVQSWYGIRLVAQVLFGVRQTDR